MVPGILTDVRAVGNLGSALRAADPAEGRSCARQYFLAGRSAIPSWTQFEQPVTITPIVKSWRKQMPLVGNLSEFPLPEVLLLIGTRTGRLRIYDLAEFSPVELDLSEGDAHGLHISDYFLTEPSQIVRELSFMVETGDGMFEFSAQPIPSVQRDEPLPINQLVMLLVLHVDEKLAKQRALLAPQLFYMLGEVPPKMGIDPGLNLFYQQSRQLLSDGVRSEDLAHYLGLEQNLVQQNLDNLHQLGFVKLMETSDVEALRETMVEQEISQKTNEFQLAGEAASLIRRSGKLLKIPSRQSGS
jgi:hypothetical protein